jgi:hypothetical protein
VHWVVVAVGTMTLLVLVAGLVAVAVEGILYRSLLAVLRVAQTLLQVERVAV